MVMKAMLIGLLVIGAVAMLETGANAHRHCDGWRCMEFTPKELEKVVAEVKKHESSEVWMIGFTDRVGSSKEFDRVERKLADVREMLIQRGLQPDIIRWLILEGYAPVASRLRGQKVIVAWPK
jgi:hypothetical protein